MGVQGLSPLTHCSIHAHSMGVQGVFNTHSLAFTCTQKHSGGVQYSLTGVHAHSQVFRACSVLTQIRTFSWPDHSESHSTMTQRRSCTRIGCSGAVQYSLIGVHAHSQVFMGCSILTHWCSCALTILTHRCSDSSKM